MRRVLLDANLIIAVFDESGSTSQDIRQAAKNTFQILLEDDDVAFAISPLIRYEVLRGVGWQDKALLERLSEILGQFEEFDINKEISELSANLFRYDSFHNRSNKNIEKRKFDVFHFSTAKCCQLEIHSEDSDISKLESLYSEYLNKC